MRESKLFGIMAHPVHHSLSPLMHNKAFQYLNLPYYYQAFDVPPEHLEEAVKAMRILGIEGVNISIPHKEKIIPYLDEVETEARVIGAVNTVVREQDGRLKGYNTDGAGYVQSLIRETNISLSKTSTLVLGAGGAAKGIAVYLLKEGCSNLCITNRNLSKAQDLVLQLQQYSAEEGLSRSIEWKSWDEAEREVDLFSLVINTTPVGMWPQTDSSPILLPDSLSFAQEKVFSDIVYNPLKTKILLQAEERGAKIHTGVGMFIYQGALAFQKFTREDPPIEVMQKIVMDRLQQGG